MSVSEENISTFAQIVDKLRLMNETELKLAYMNLFEKDLESKWKELVDGMNFDNVSEEDITNTFNQQRNQKTA